MDADVFKLLTGFIVKGRKLLGSIDSDRLLRDDGYAREVFRKVDEEGEEDLVLLALQLRDRLGLLARGAEPEKDKAKDRGEAAAGKYVHGLRS